MHIGQPNIGNRDAFWIFAHEHRFISMNMLLFSSSAIIFLIGPPSEQITALPYKTDIRNVFGDFLVRMIASCHGV